WLELTYFYGLGAVIIFFGAVALGRLSVRSARDIAYTQRGVAAYEGHPVANYSDETYTERPVAAAAQPAPSEEVTEIQPTRGGHRGWRDMFGGGRRPAHR